MLCKVLSIPFRLISGIIKVITALMGTIVSLGFGTVRLVVNRLFGTLFGALVGLFLGKKHLKVKMFTGKKS